METKKGTSQHSIDITSGKTRRKHTTMQRGTVQFAASLFFGTHTCSDQPIHENLAAKIAVDKVWSKLHKLPAWNTSKVSRKQDAINEAKVNRQTTSFSALVGICNLQHYHCAETAPKTTQVVMQCPPNKEASASPVTTAEVLDTISWLPGMSGEANDVVSAYTQVKMSDQVTQASGDGTPNSMDKAPSKPVVRNMGITKVVRKFTGRHVFMFTDKLNSSYQHMSTTRSHATHRSSLFRMHAT